MPSLKQHCYDCKTILGNEYKEVHEWLDELAFKDGKLDTEHHKFRHHLLGVEFIRSKFGDDAAKAAEIHIVRDIHGIPKDAQDCEHGCFLDWKYYGQNHFAYPEVIY